MKPAIFSALPGIETPVGEVRRALAAVWDAEPEATAKGEPTEFRASQMNLVVHFGLDTAVPQANAGFATALEFSRRYPCRIIALCPSPEGEGGELAAKIFCECYIGASRDDMTCTEAIILTYPLEQRAYLEDQASILLESDLPVFYWPQHINRASRLVDYGFFLRASQRIVIDRAIEKPDVADFPWPRPEVVHDLAWGRILPLRQAMGHFLSYIAPARLVRGLRRIELRHRPAFAAEGRALVRWMEHGVDACRREAKPAPEGTRDPADIIVRSPDEQLAGSIAVVWSYEDGGRLIFNFDFEHHTAVLESTLDDEPNRVGASIQLLPPARALAEVLFF